MDAVGGTRVRAGDGDVGGGGDGGGGEGGGEGGSGRSTLKLTTNPWLETDDGVYRHVVAKRYGSLDQ
ncbi:hypothetical protein M0804_006205 [Polistes exclamans]|nr:hypothetical protein M0804_006205 [Polistes exclamans]